MRRNRQNNQLSLWNSDPFEDIRRMQRDMFAPFANSMFGNDDFFAGFGQMSRNIERMHMDMGMNMANMDINIDNMGGDGQYVMQSYTSKTVIGPDGKPVTEKSVQKQVSTVGRDGKRIVERDNIYKHSGHNIKKVEKERQLGDQRIKVTKEINNNERNEYRDLQNMDESEVDTFNARFNKYASENGHGVGQITYKPAQGGNVRRIRALQY